MPPSVAVDLVTYDRIHDEFVLYFVFDGPWPTETAEWAICLRAIQDKVFDAVDAAVDGGVAKLFPDSLGKNVRIQIDSPSGCPDVVTNLVTRINNYIATTIEYKNAIRASTNVRGVRIVTGHEMGRFAGKKESS